MIYDQDNQATWTEVASVRTSVSPLRSKIAIVGLGGVGGVVAGCLRIADQHDVIACSRSGAGRLVLDSPDGSVDLDISTLTDPLEAGPVDWVLLCTKTQQTASSLPWLSRLCNSRTRVAVLQNGVDHERRVAPFIGEATVLSTVVYYNGERISKGRVRLRHVAEYDLAVQDDDDGRAFRSLFVGTQLNVLLSKEFRTLVWRKLLINIVANPITALTLLRQEVLRRPDIRSLCFAVIEEAVAVARADGVELAADEAAVVMTTLLSYPAEAGTSMYFDRMASRSLEVDALTGAVVTGGQKYGIPTPLNAVFLSLLRAISESAEGSISLIGGAKN